MSSAYKGAKVFVGVTMILVGAAAIFTAFAVPIYQGVSWLK